VYAVRLRGAVLTRHTGCSMGDRAVPARLTITTALNEAAVCDPTDRQPPATASKFTRSTDDVVATPNEVNILRAAIPCDLSSIIRIELPYFLSVLQGRRFTSVAETLIYTLFTQLCASRSPATAPRYRAFLVSVMFASTPLLARSQH
jgi:hypothetical protein